MKPRILLLAISLLAFGISRANAIDAGEKGKKNDLNGIVVNSENKKPLKDVSVTAYCTSKKEKIVVTDETGNFSFDELKPGTYKFIFEKTGFKRVTKEKVVVKTDEAFQLNIEMIQSNDFDLMPSPFHFIEVN
ncbi:MAG TPA: carboxypeptidase-like regulatory domain-containing protein [Chitinophagaceae bacterium]|nr:carboxypeptidase-like regulatory domain-containing protein [Chitinophagaceae bacterium]